MSRPSSRNALGTKMLSELAAAVESLPRNPSVRAVVLASDVDRVFCAGADLKERRSMTQEEAGAFVEELRSCFTA